MWLGSIRKLNSACYSKRETKVCLNQPQYGRHPLLMGICCGSSHIGGALHYRPGVVSGFCLHGVSPPVVFSSGGLGFVNIIASLWFLKFSDIHPRGQGIVPALGTGIAVSSWYLRTRSKGKLFEDKIPRPEQRLGHIFFCSMLLIPLSTVKPQLIQSQCSPSLPGTFVLLDPNFLDYLGRFNQVSAEQGSMITTACLLRCIFQAFDSCLVLP